MKPLAHIHRDLTTTVDDVEDTDERLLSDSGDIILNLLDAWIPDAFYEQEVLERWADGWKFNLRDISAPDALQKMLAAFMYPTISEVAPEFSNAIEPLRGAEIPKADLEGELGEMLDFPVRVDGRVLRHFLCDVYDGPFDDDEELLGSSCGAPDGRRTTGTGRWMASRRRP